MATVTRGATVLTPADVVGLSLTRTSRTVVLDVLGDPEPDVIAAEPRLRSGSLVLRWERAGLAEAEAAVAALSTIGGPWEFDHPEQSWSLLAKVVGDVQLDSLTDDGAAWSVTVGVQEVAP